MEALSIRFKLFGIPIRIEPTFFLLGFLFYQWSASAANPLLATVEIMAWVLIAVLVHEMGHALAVRSYGLEPKILLYVIGGKAYWEQEVGTPLSNGQHIWIALAGPLAGFLLGTIVWIYGGILGAPMPAFSLDPMQVYQYVIYFTIYWSILNLLPIYPLDGGQVLFYALNQHPRWNARLLTAVFTLALGGALIFLAIRAGEWWITILLAFILYNNFRLLQSSRDQQLNKKVEVIARQLETGAVDQAIEGAKVVLAEAKSEAYRSWALSLLGRLYAQQGKWEQIVELSRHHAALDEIVPEVKIHALLHTEGLDAALDFARKAFSMHPGLELATLNVNLLVKQGKYGQVLDLLKLTRSHPYYAQLLEHVQGIFQTEPHRSQLMKYPALSKWLETTKLSPS